MYKRLFIIDACHGRLSRFYQKFLTNILLPPAYPNFPFLFLNTTLDTDESTFNFQILECEIDHTILVKSFEEELSELDIWRKK